MVILCLKKAVIHMAAATTIIMHTSTATSICIVMIITITIIVVIIIIVPTITAPAIDSLP